MRDKLGLVNAAMAAFGATPLQSLDAETPAGRAADLAYDATVDAMLGFYPWSFARMTVPLTQLADEPVNGWAHKYLLPSNRLSLPHRILANPRDPDRTLKAWAIEAGHLYADAEPLWGVFSFRVDPEDWSPVFYQAVIYALAAALVVPISGNATGAVETMRALAFGTPGENMRGGFMGQAMQADARNQPSRALGFDDNPLAMERA
ncbi:hypothetical protein SAMN04515666_101352 [Bosea lupini]|uniref:Uncharacterized protein n=1 Tax=Bosea lupini TaxID=1036779 RepID=A0A1H7GIF5_9HYPH|nr:hypothetical protein [Bosea lupini]SEK37337.1 hypothetical protein SAMN04515666_101352 [Bosea lupini]